MRLFICIDDTDNIEKGRGTGRLAQEIKEHIEEMFWGSVSRITRHQLFLHEDIPYTSHNSSMCFIVDTVEYSYERIKDYCIEFLIREQAEGSDPGLCIVKYNDAIDYGELMDYGFETKFMIKTKKEAYVLAEKNGYHLSEHGGTGLGIIGALAGVGLRMSGNDGEFKGRLDFIGDRDSLKPYYRAEELLQYKEIEGIVTGCTKDIVGKGQVIIGGKTKTVLVNGRSVLLVKALGDGYKALSKKEIREFGDEYGYKVFQSRRG